MTAGERDAFNQGAQAMQLAAMAKLQEWVDAVKRDNPLSLSACNFAAAKVVVELTIRPSPPEAL